MVTACFRILIFIISVLGTWELVRRLLNIHVSFIPGLTVAIHVTILFFGGLWNLLPETAYILCVAGIAAFVVAAVRSKGISFLRHYIHPAYLFLFIFAFIMLVVLHGRVFVSYDNFSHWALALKCMLRTDRYPNFLDRIIFFKEYPLGSTTFIYYVCHLTVIREDVQMMVQAYMIIVSMMPLFARLEKNRLAGSVVIYAAANFFMMFCVSPVNLYVDTLLALVSASGLLYASYYRNAVDRRTFLPVMFYMIQILQIKNSGVFFAAVAALYIVFEIRRKGQAAVRIPCALAPFFTVVLWHKHCAYVMEKAEHSKHAMTFSNYKAIFGEKTAEDIENIIHASVKESLTYKGTLVTALMSALIGIIIFFLCREYLGYYRRIVIMCVLVYAAYQSGVTAMYVFSMPLNEAVRLAAFERYTKTILIFLLYLMLASLMRAISASLLSRMSLMGVAALSACLFFGHMYLSSGKIHTIFRLKEDAGRSEIRSWLDSVRRDYHIPEGKTYTLLTTEEDSDYSYWLMRYLFFSPDVISKAVKDSDYLDSISSDYILVYDRDNELINDWITEHYPNQVGKSVIYTR